MLSQPRMRVKLTATRRRAGRRSIRTQVLAIVLVPSCLLLAVGIAFAAYLFHTGASAQDFANKSVASARLGASYAASVEEERRLSLLKLAGDPQVTAALDAQRAQTDSLSVQAETALGGLSAANAQATSQANSADMLQLATELPVVRKEVDSGSISLDDAYYYYNQLFNTQSVVLRDFARSAINADVGVEMDTASSLLDVAGRMSRGNALGVAGYISGGLTLSQFEDFATDIGGYHSILDTVRPQLTSDEQSQYSQLTASTAWQQLLQMENAVLAHGPWPNAPADPAALPFSIATWETDIQQVDSTLLGLWQTQSVHAQQLAADAGQSTVTQSVLGGVAALLVTLIAMIIAVLLSNRLITRMRRLRAETLELADTRLPHLVARLREGEQVDVDSEVPPLDHGTDELGQVADAFNKAQHTAVAAAVAESETRKGVNAVFLNLAHRSQVVVHRQLEVLDKAEYNQEDPEQLELLFQLDHLATRARRNAENLVILGGEQPRRQWRNPVALSEIVRAAAAETEEYARIRITRLPEEHVSGAAVADLIHLLAELLDNATSFSPPDSRVDVSGNQAGRGVIIEITDQGLGMPVEDLEKINAQLREAPEFSAMRLSSDSRLGLFVVGRLAAQHGIAVRLAESEYGGVRAVVLIPTALTMANQPAPSEPVAIEPPVITKAIPAKRANGAHRRNGHSRPALPAAHRLPADAPAPRWPTEEPVGEPVGQQPPIVLPAAPIARPPAERPVERPPVERPRLTMAHPPARRERRPLPPPTEGRPDLPRRRRLANLAPQLTQQMTPVPADEPEKDVPAEQSRDFMAAIQFGTRRARHTHDDDPASSSTRAE